MPLASRPIRELFAHPERRWWLTPARSPLVVPVVLSDEGRELVATTFDISESGLYVEISARLREQLEPGRVLGLSLDLVAKGPEGVASTHVSCLAEVVRLSSGSGRHPQGVGMKFLDLPDNARAIIARMSRVTQLARSSSPA
jgi:hypothetical protein